MKFCNCEHCGNIVEYVKDKGVPVVCCGEKMKEIVPNTIDASKEKHVPVISQTGNTVVITVGSVEHPMLAEHFIEWIVIETKQGSQRKNLAPTERPLATFALADGDELVAVYEFCNLHGLWKASV